MDLAVTTVSINRFLISSSDESDESDDDVIILKMAKSEKNYSLGKKSVQFMALDKRSSEGTFLVVGRVKFDIFNYVVKQMGPLRQGAVVNSRGSEMNM